VCMCVCVRVCVWVLMCVSVYINIIAHPAWSLSTPPDFQMSCLKITILVIEWFQYLQQILLFCMTCQHTLNRCMSEDRIWKYIYIWKKYICIKNKSAVLENIWKKICICTTICFAWVTTGSGKYIVARVNAPVILLQYLQHILSHALSSHVVWCLCIYSWIYIDKCMYICMYIYRVIMTCCVMFLYT